ncbi:MAG: ribosome silencing factor [Lachnospiraceae bacterium]|nr:ribosome silencing factor [Lachnospiraceae bacterium]
MEKTIRLIKEALDDKKAEDISILDISQISVMADIMVIATAANVNQIQAMCDNIEEKMKEIGKYYDHIEGYRSGNWILMDYKDIIIHLFCKDDRAYYDIDHIWSDGKKVSI